MKGWIWVIVLILVGYILGAKYPGMFNKVVGGMAG